MKTRSVSSRVLYIITSLCTIFILIPAVSPAKEYSLNDLYMIALERAEGLKVSEEELYIAERNRDKALSLLFPKLSAFGGYSRFSTERRTSTGLVTQPDESYLWGIRLDHLLSMSGREITGIDIARDNIKRSQYYFQALREDYMLSVATSYYGVLKAQKSLEIAIANQQRLIRHRDAAKVRLEAGEITKTDLLRAEAELSGAQAEVIRAENNLKLAKAALARVTGLTEDFDIVKQGYDIEESELKTFCPDVISLECLRLTALSERPEIKAATIQKKIAEGQVTYAKGSYWPSLSIQAMYIRKEEEPVSAFLNKESLFAGLTLNFPLLEGGLRRAEVREKEAMLRQAQLLYEDIKKTIELEVERAYLEFITQKETLNSLSERLSYAKDNYKTVSRQYELGLATSIDVIDANTLYLTSERQLSETRFEYELSLVKLKKETGILFKTIKR